MATRPEARSFLPIDLPLMRRLTAHGVSLDTATNLTRGVNLLEGAFWSAVPLTDLGTPTFVLRDGDSGYIAQFRHKMGEQHAHIVFIAPDLDKCESDDAWLHLIDAMVYAAGRRGAISLNAEVDENSAAFVLLRQCGFAIYARQQLWRREAAPQPGVAKTLLRPETESDSFGINALYTSIVPRLVLQADAPPETGRGLVCEQNGRVAAYFSVQEGKSGIFVQSYLHPEMYDQTAALHNEVLAHLPRSERGPVYMCVRRYHDWLRGTLAELGFEAFANQAVMVKHTVARIEHPILRAVAAFEGAVRVTPTIRVKSGVISKP